MKLFLKAVALITSAALAAPLGGRTKMEYKIEKDPDFAQKPRICLTFDDGPTRVTEKVLDVLKENGVPAAFFVIGKNAEKNPKIMQRIFREGHTVGIHTYSHVYKEIYASPEALKADINDCCRAIKTAFRNYTPKYYRFPGGSFGLSEGLLRVPVELNLKSVDWNAACRDSEIKAEFPSELTGYALSTAAGKNSVIMLLHDAADKLLTAEALPDIIRAFKNRGYYFTDLDGILTY